eukprot:scaffold1340_cov277-Chaetoceros_neogracile.AAC.1
MSRSKVLFGFDDQRDKDFISITMFESGGMTTMMWKQLKGTSHKPKSYSTNAKYISRMQQEDPGILQQLKPDCSEDSTTRIGKGAACIYAQENEGMI